MGTSCAIHLLGAAHARCERIASRLQAETERLETCYSRYRADSLISTINRSAGNGQWTALNSESNALFDYVDTVYRQSDGAFDVTSGVLRNCWDFRSGRIPVEAEINKYVRLVGWSRVERAGGMIRLPLPGMELDLGGIVKEYAADRLAELAGQSPGVSGLIDLGGDIRAIGELHPPWPIGVKDPYAPDNALATIPLGSGAIASSGNYERCIEVDGTRYGHLLDAGTGWPVMGMQTVSVWAPTCVVAGSVTTVALLKNETAGLRWLREIELPFVAVGRDGRLITS